MALESTPRAFSEQRLITLSVLLFQMPLANDPQADFNIYFPLQVLACKSIRLAGIPVFCVSIRCCLLSCYGLEELMRVGKADNRVVSPLLSPVSGWNGRFLSDLHLLPERLQLLL